MITRIEVALDAMIMRALASEGYKSYITSDMVTILLSRKAYVILGAAGKLAFSDRDTFYRGYKVRLVSEDSVEMWVAIEHMEVLEDGSAQV